MAPKEILKNKEKTRKLKNDVSILGRSAVSALLPGAPSPRSHKIQNRKEKEKEKKKHKK